MESAVSPVAQTPPPPPAPPADAAADAAPPRNRNAAHRTPARPAPQDSGALKQFLALRNMGLLDYLETQWRKHGDVFRVKLGPANAVVVVHPDGMERVLASNRENYIKGKTYKGARAVLGDGILTAMGDDWRKRRTLMQPRFHRAALEGLVDAMTQRSVAYFDGLQEGERDAHHAMIDITLDIVVSSLFGTPDVVDIDYKVLGETLAALGERSNAFQLPLSIPTPGNLRFSRVMTSLDRMVNEVITEAKAKPNPSTLLNMLMTSLDAETGKPLERSDIRNEIVTLFVAGHETTALTMTWMFLLLEHEPDVVEKMIEEVDRVLQGRAPTLDDLPNLDYLRKVAEETLRLRSPVALVARNTVNDDNIMGFQIKRDDMIIPFFHGLHRHPDFWKNPEVFDPERFTPEAKVGRDLWSYLPFSGGQRVCLCNHFALFETQVILATMLQRFRFQVVPGQTVKPLVQATVRPSAPVRVKFTRR